MMSRSARVGVIRLVRSMPVLHEAISDRHANKYMVCFSFNFRYFEVV